MSGKYWLATRLAIALVCTLLCLTVQAEQYSSLYGFSLGDKITDINSRLGEPGEVIDLEHESKAFVYFSDSHYVAFVALGPENDTVYSIQLTGKSSKGPHGLDGINLGIPIKIALDKFGPPTSSREATDQQTKKVVAKTTIHFYGENFSLEETDGIVSSIKLTHDKTLSSDSPADEKQFSKQPDEIKKLRDFILNQDYPEVFNEKTYRVTIDDIQLIDLDSDGQLEAVVLYRPHFLQSPTIVIYQFLLDGSIKRVTESLAPGPLVKRADYFLDSHSLGEAVDFSMTEKNLTTEQYRKIAETASDSFNLVVQYRDFIHGDNRSGEPIFIDMSQVEFSSNNQSCEKFEFSRVDAINVGYKDNGGNSGMIAALVGKKIYIYQINAINDNGYLEKELTIVDSEN
jgi:hypothetical protein